MSPGEAAATVLGATGRGAVAEAVTWIANGLTLTPDTDLHCLLRALAVLNPGDPDGAKALQVITRRVTRSELDSAAILFKAESIVPASAFREALDLLARHSPEKRLRNINASAVIAAQRDNPFVIHALCAVAGLSYSDLTERVPGLPGDPSAPWGPAQARSAFALIDEITSGRVTTRLPNTIPTRPLDLMPSVVGPRSVTGWEAVELQATQGVPYEVLLAQRAAGGTWLAHRNLTSGLLNHRIADELVRELDAEGLEYRRSTLVGGTHAPGLIQDLARSDKQVGVVILNKRAGGVYAVVFASARDSGTASKSAARLRMMKHDPKIPLAIVLSGPGWAARNETADLALAFGGRLFSDMGIIALVRDVKAILGESATRT